MEGVDWVRRREEGNRMNRLGEETERVLEGTTGLEISISGTSQISKTMESLRNLRG